MSMSDLQIAFKIIEDYMDEADFEGTKSDDFVAMAEAALETKFPPTYRAFLRRLGCGDIFGLEIYGLTQPDFINASIPNGVWLTLSERRISNLPSELVLVAETGEGTYYAIDTSVTNNDGDCPIVEWDPAISKNSSPYPVAYSDFGEFLRGQLEERL